VSTATDMAVEVYPRRKQLQCGQQRPNFHHDCSIERVQADEALVESKLTLIPGECKDQRCESYWREAAALPRLALPTCLYIA
jgi:hypothetical protein